MSVVSKLATWADIEATPEGVKAEVIAGHLITAMARPKPVHGRAQSCMAAIIGGPFDLGTGGPGGWWIVIEPDVSLGPHDIVSPDVVGWRRSRMPLLPEARPIEVVPDWTCEILSPRTRTRDRTDKANLYLRAGIPHYWIVDADDRTLEAFAAREGQWLRLGAWTDGHRVRVAPFDAVEIDVGALFPPLGEAQR